MKIKYVFAFSNSFLKIDLNQMLRILEFLPVNFVHFLKIRLTFNIFYCFWIFVNKLFTYLTCAYLKSKRCFNVKSSTYFFHMNTHILADFQIFKKMICSWRYFKDTCSELFLIFVEKYLRWSLILRKLQYVELHFFRTKCSTKYISQEFTKIST